MRKYLENGQELEIIEETNDGYVIAEVLMTVGQNAGDEIISSGRSYMPKNKIFDESPIKKFSSQIATLQQDIAFLKSTKRDLEIKIDNVHKNNKVKLELYDQHKQLKDLDDYLEGKITHYAELGCRPKIVEFKDTKDDYDGRDLKLLTLFGASNGDLHWQLNKYKDGSGSYTKVIPCLSFEEARQALESYVNEELKSDAWNAEGLLEVAKEYNLKVGKKYFKEERLRQIEKYKKKIKGLKNDLKISEKKLQKVIKNE